MSLDPYSITISDRLAAEVSVLIVDDHIAVAKLVAKLFKAVGITKTALAFDTQVARQHVVEQKPNIIVVDANVEPMKAPAFITLIRRLSTVNPILLLMATSIDSEAARASREAGLDGVLLQPFTAPELKHTLETAMHFRSVAKGSPITPSRSKVEYV